MAWKIKRRFKWGLLFFITVWVIFAQSCMKFRIDDNSAKKEFEQKGLSVHFFTMKEDGMPLHYAKTGSDTLPTLFFVHGSPGSWDAFKIYMMDSALLQKFRIISIDRPGFGYSDFGTAYHLPYQASLISKIVEKENNHKPVHLVGHSIGGPVIVQLAQEHPAAFASLTILAGSISPEDEPKEYWRYAFTYSPLKFLMPGAFRPSNDEIVYFKKELYKLDERYNRLQMPVTFIHGEKDRFVTVKNVDYGKRKLVHNPQLKVIIIPGAGHFIPWEHFDIIRSHLLTLAGN
ncbi:MAG TPA: alpha/beta hydrolase [Ferruginibacter sp.]|nr:alpha/beta hydrolase [Ferruginibacter sp.]